MKGSIIAKVVCANDVDTGLNDFGTTNVVQENLLSRVTFVKGLETNFELFPATQENLVVKIALEDNAFECETCNYHIHR